MGWRPSRSKTTTWSSEESEVSGSSCGWSGQLGLQLPLTVLVRQEDLVRVRARVRARARVSSPPRTLA